MKVRFHAPPTRVNILGRSYIAGMYGDWVEYSDERMRDLENQFQEQRKPVRAWKVQSSTKSWVTYYIRRIGGEWSCTCPGFVYREDCKHVRMAKENFDEVQ